METLLVSFSLWYRSVVTKTAAIATVTATTTTTLDASTLPPITPAAVTLDAVTLVAETIPGRQLDPSTLAVATVTVTSVVPGATTTPNLRCSRQHALVLRTRDMHRRKRRQHLSGSLFRHDWLCEYPCT